MMTLRRWGSGAFAPGLALVAGVLAGPLYAQEPAESRAPFTFQGQTWVSQKAFVESGARCATRPVDSIETEESTRTVDRFRAERGSVDRAAGSVTVGVWVYVINKGAGIANGDVPQSQIDAQIQVVNDAYSGLGGGGAADTPFRFLLLGVTRTTNAAWFAMTPGSAAEAAAKAALRVGGPSWLEGRACTAAHARRSGRDRGRRRFAPGRGPAR